APNVMYAVPAFGWNVSRSSDTATSTRTGGWVRVYLDRPFYSSGAGELLGVVLLNDSSQVDVIRERQGRLGRLIRRHAEPASGVAARLETYVTQWGMDPLWLAPPILNPPTIADFPGATTQSGLYLEELGGMQDPHATPVAVAGFPVTYDDSRCLYYADIQCAWGNAYYPHMRLALAAYQPSSLDPAAIRPHSAADTVHLSRVVLVD